MKKINLFALALLFVGAIACNNPDSAGEKMEEDVEEVGEDIEEGVEEMGESVEEATEDMDDGMQAEEAEPATTEEAAH